MSSKERLTTIRRAAARAASSEAYDVFHDVATDAETYGLQDLIRAREAYREACDHEDSVFVWGAS